MSLSYVDRSAIIKSKSTGKQETGRDKSKILHASIHICYAVHLMKGVRHRTYCHQTYTSCGYLSAVRQRSSKPLSSEIQ